MKRIELIRMCEKSHDNRDTITRLNNGNGYYVCGGCANTLRTTKGNEVNIFNFMEQHKGDNK